MSLVELSYLPKEGKQFYILGNGKNIPLSDLRQEKSGFPWMSQNLNGQFIILKDGVYINDGISVSCVQWFLQKGAIVIAENPWCIGEEGGRIIADLEESRTPGYCYLGRVTIGGFSGMGISYRANAWLESKKPTDELMELYELYKKTKE